MVRPADEWRTVFHFALADVPATWSAVELAIPIHCLDLGPPDGEIDLGVFAGDGTVSLDEFMCSAPVQTTFMGITDEYPVLTYDVTTLVADYIVAGYTHIAFRVQAGGSTDRYDLGSVGGVADPTLVVHP